MDLSSLVSGLTTSSSPSSYTIHSPSNESPTKPGFDWGALGASLQDLGGGVSDVIRAVRGIPVSGRMAGSRLQDYLQEKKGGSSLEALLKELITQAQRGTGSSEPNEISSTFDIYTKNPQPSSIYDPGAGKLNFMMPGGGMFDQM